MPEFKFNVGDEVQDAITQFKGIVTARTQWLNNCNTYGVQSRVLKDGVPQDKAYFDEPQLSLVKEACLESKQTTGGPERSIKRSIKVQ